MSRILILLCYRPCSKGKKVASRLTSIRNQTGFGQIDFRKILEWLGGKLLGRAAGCKITTAHIDQPGATRKTLNIAISFFSPPISLIYTSSIKLPKPTSSVVHQHKQVSYVQLPGKEEYFLWGMDENITWVPKNINL